jgi:UDP-N-acetyl-2-amino-2-deoxyglucuronate dehydrogenase
LNKVGEEIVLSFALVGCGRIAKRHSELLGLNQIKGARLVSTCDLIEEKARKIGERFSVPYYTDMHHMMAREKIDVVVVLTESGNHAHNVVNLAKYGKHIVVEKPMALRLEDADAMINECNINGAKLFVVKQNRFNLPIVKLREALNEGRFGKLVLGTVRVRWCRKQAYYDQDSWRGTWLMDGGVLANQAIHHVDMLQWMMGDVESVFALGSTFSANIEAEDTAVAVLRFRNGALGVVEATTATRPTDLEGSISILGEGGSVEIGGFAVNEIKTWSFAKPMDGDSDVISKHSVNPPNVYGFGHQAFYEHVVACLTSNVPQCLDGMVGRKSLELTHAIYESIETRKEVFLGVGNRQSRLGALP